jgi:hypothetical protein
LQNSSASVARDSPFSHARPRGQIAPIQASSVAPKKP